MQEGEREEKSQRENMPLKEKTTMRRKRRKRKREGIVSLERISVVHTSAERERKRERWKRS